MKIKNKIAAKLSLYFLSILLLFSILVGSAFFFLFQSYTFNQEQQELKERAVRVASLISRSENGTSQPRTNGAHMENPPPHRRPMMGLARNTEDSDGGSYRNYLRFLDNMPTTDLWIINEQRQLFVPERSQKNFAYKDLPDDASHVVAEVFKGKVKVSRDFTGLINVPTLTVGAPIKDSSGKVIGAVLLHKPISGVTHILYQGAILLSTSLLFALVLALGLAIWLSYRFTNPLNTIRQTALELYQGNYSAKSNLTLTDEIGQLGNTVDELSDRLYQASKESERLEKFRKDFIINLSHELRTPVTVIRGSLEALVDHIIKQPDQVAEYHQQMLKEAELLQRLIGDLMDLSKLQNENFPITTELLNLWEPLEDSLRTARALGAKKSVLLQAPESFSPYPFQGDYLRLKQLFTIILDNAIKFSASGGKIEITQSNQTLSIRDYGKGIEAAALPYIFERYYRSPDKDNQSGMGLGLAIAKQIAQRHQITIEALQPEDQLGGIEFRFIFPPPEKFDSSLS